MVPHCRNGSCRSLRTKPLCVLVTSNFFFWVKNLSTGTTTSLAARTPNGFNFKIIFAPPLWIEIRLHQFVYLIVPYSFSLLELGKSVCLSPKMLELHCNHTKLFQRGKKMTSKKQWPLSDQFQWLSMLPKDLFISTKKEFIMNQVCKYYRESPHFVIS